MASPKRDQFSPGAGKLLDSADVVFDLTAFYKKMDGVLDAVNGLKVDAVIETGDIEIGAVELKDATSTDRANISAANTSRSASDKVLLVQNIAADGSVGSGGSPANTARTAATVVSPSQAVDPAGNVSTLETAGADAVTNTKNILPVSSWLKAFNGSTWDRLRAGITAVSATLTGFLNTLPWAVYNSTPTARTTGQGGPLQSDVNGNLNGNLNTYLRGEDLVYNVLKTQTRGTYTVPLTASGLVFTGPGQLMGFIVNSCAAGATLKVWDNTSAATTVALDTMTFTAAVAQGPQVVMLPAAVQLNTGCYFTIAVAAMSVTPIWNQS